MVSKEATKAKRLKAAVTHHYKQLSTLRDRREEFLRAASGSLYPHAEPQDARLDILNLMRQAAEAQTLSLAANRPRVSATAKTQERQAFADHYKAALNAYVKTMRLEEALQECARNAFYSLGVMKVYMADSVAVELEVDEWMDPGQPFAQSISPHHLTYDTDATDWRHCSFIADRYQVRFEDIIDDVRFPKKIRDRLKDRGPRKLHGQSDEWGNQLANGDDPSQFEEKIYLADVFLPKDGTIFTYVCNSQFELEGEALKELDWDGSETGPFRFLNLGPVPDKTTPSSPAQNLLLQHNLVNSLYRKLEAQSVRQKILNVGVVGDGDDSKKVRDAKDGEFVELNSPQAITQLRMDGPDQPVFSFALNALEQFNKIAGNLDHKLGLAATADTARQQGMIGQSVGRMEAFYQTRFVAFTREVIQELGRLLFSDATTTVEMTKEVEGTDFVVDAPWLGAVAEGSRMGEFKDYDLDVEPYSMSYKSPEDRMAEMDMQIQMIMPMLPILAQQGKMLDMQYWLKKRAEYSDLPELERLIMDIPQPPEQPKGGPHERTLPGGGGGQPPPSGGGQPPSGGGGGVDPTQLAQNPQQGVM